MKFASKRIHRRTRDAIIPHSFKGPLLLEAQPTDPIEKVYHLDYLSRLWFAPGGLFLSVMHLLAVASYKPTRPTVYSTPTFRTHACSRRHAHDWSLSYHMHKEACICHTDRYLKWGSKIDAAGVRIDACQTAYSLYMHVIRLKFWDKTGIFLLLSIGREHIHR